MTQSRMQMSRRDLMGGLGAGAALTAGLVAPTTGQAAGTLATGPRSLSLFHVHTKEEIEVAYHDGTRYDRGALNALTEFMRDWRTEEIWRMDPKVLDIVATLSERLAPQEPIHIISGYRSPRTNAMLNASTSGVATRSLHMIGKAIDFVMPDRDLNALYGEALALKAGGVGIYSRSRFIHVDTGRVKTWGS